MTLHTNNRVKKHVSWEEFHKNAIKLSEIIKAENNDIKGIVAIARGGLMPALIVSYELNITKSDILELSSYDEKGFNHQAIVKQLPYYALQSKGEGWIIVDELLDGGNSIKKAKEILPLAKSYVVYSKIEEKPNYLDGYIEYTPKNYWLCLPWSYGKD